MALNVGDNFSYQGKKPNFARDTFSTLAEMKSYPATSIDEGHISLCLEDGKRYKFSADFSVDATTGQWRRIVDTALDATSENPVQNKVINAKFVAEEQAVAGLLLQMTNSFDEKLAQQKSDLQDEIMNSSSDTDEKIEESEKVVAQAIGEVKEEINDLALATAGAFNDLKNKVVDGTSTTINGYELRGDITITKADVGLDQVDNTSDEDKPISNATSEALRNKVDKVTGKSLVQDSLISKLSALPTADSLSQAFEETNGNISDHKNDTHNPHGVTADQLGLSGYTDYTPETLPISSDTQDALDGKVDKTLKISTHPLDGDITLSPGDVNLGNVDNTSDLNKPLSNPQREAIEADEAVIVSAIADLRKDYEDLVAALAGALNSLWVENVELKKRITNLGG